VEDEDATFKDEVERVHEEMEKEKRELVQLREDKLKEDNRKQKQLTDRAKKWREDLETEIQDREIANRKLEENFTSLLNKSFLKLSEDLHKVFDEYDNAIIDPEKENSSEQQALPDAVKKQARTHTSNRQSIKIATDKNDITPEHSVQPPPPGEKKDEDDGPLEQRVRIVRTNFKDFTEIKVPSDIDNATGQIERQLKKYQESFDIDNAKLVKREEKIRDRLKEFKIQTKNSFDDEKLTRRSKYLEILENLDDISRKEDRESERQHTKIVNDLATEKERLRRTIKMREATDTEIIENIKANMARMQKSILSHLSNPNNKRF